jgi:hypothetical protein
MAPEPDPSEELPNSFFTAHGFKENLATTRSDTLDLMQTNTYNTLERTETVRTLAGGLIKLRARSDNLPQ